MKSAGKVRRLVANAPPPEKLTLLGPTSLRCPHCRAKPGVDCLDWWGRPRRPHDRRMQQFWDDLRRSAWQK